MKKTLIIILLVLTSVSFLYSQSKEVYDYYMDNASYNAVLYRGRIKTPLNFRYQGTPFAYTEDFTQGKLFYNGKEYYDVWLNINSYTDELEVRYSPDRQNQTIVLEKKLVKYFIVNDKKFEYIAGKSIPDGFYEILHDGKSDLIKKNKKMLIEEENLTRNKIFMSSNSYYILLNGIYYPVKGKSAFAKCFKERKKDIKRVSRQFSSLRSDDKDAYYITIFTQGCNQ